MTSLKQQLLDYLIEKKRFVHNGELERYAQSLNFMGSNGSRRMRELAREGKVEVIYQKNERTGTKEANYRAMQYNISGQKIN